MNHPPREHAAPPDEQPGSPALSAADGGAAVLLSSCPLPLGSLASPPVSLGSRRCPPHFYDLPPPDGPTCIGVCRHCGNEREHRNSNPYDRRTYGQDSIEAVAQESWPLSREKESG